MPSDTGFQYCLPRGIVRSVRGTALGLSVSSRPMMRWNAPVPATRDRTRNRVAWRHRRDAAGVEGGHRFDLPLRGVDPALFRPLRDRPAAGEPGRLLDRYDGA